MYYSMNTFTNMLVQPQDMLDPKWSIGTNKKCCRLCWSLHLAYNESSSFHFALPGHDDQILPWLPPPGLPGGFLRDQRDELLKACDEASSTPEGYDDDDYDNDDPLIYPDMSLFGGAIARLPYGPLPH